MNLHDIAKEVLEVLGTGRQLDPFSKVYPDFGLKDAYNVTATVRAEREARGERSIGRKIGFTNRTIWAEYGVYAPIWGYVYDGTVQDLTPEGLEVSLSGLAEPRIEPEIVFGLAAPPAPGMDEQALIHCIDWIAHGFEIVQSIFPNWLFQAPTPSPPMASMGGSSSGRVIRQRRDGRSGRASFPASRSIFSVTEPMSITGAAANVLDGPLLALRHLAETLAQDPLSPALAAGEIVTTGTLTRAFPVAAGEEWTTRLTGIPLEPARIRFV